ncbi:MAG: citrate transporter [Lachnospiraceae bacterium]|nr:citrate transporter [Lachnospiraceae bacterium]
MKKVIAVFKKEIMLSVSILAAVISFFITPPSGELLKSIDWKTLATLFMLLSVLDGFKNENLFRPVLKLSGKIKSQAGLSFFLIFGVFFSSMFVTNDVSLIIFVPLTIILFRAENKEQYILPVISMENIAAVRGSLLTPFGSPQNLFLYSKSGMSTGSFMLMMLPLWIMSIVLLSSFILFLYRRNIKEKADTSGYVGAEWLPENRTKRIVYAVLFVIIIASIVTRTTLWPYITLFVAIVLFIFDRDVYKRVDYVLLLTFLCFFAFSSSVAANPKISGFLESSVRGHEYIWSILLSQVISNVPASIVLWPFTDNLRALIYGLDTAGLVTVIGSLASVINMRIYNREYPGKAAEFMKYFEIISLIFFIIVVVPQYFMSR